MVEELQSRVTALEAFQPRVTAFKAQLERKYYGTNPSLFFAPFGSSSRFLSSAENIAPNIIPITVNLPQLRVLSIDENLLGHLCFRGLLRLLTSIKEATPDILPTTVNLSEHGALPAYPNMSDYQAVLEGECSLKTSFPKGNVVALTTPRPEELFSNDDWYVRLSYGPGWSTYLVGIELEFNLVSRDPQEPLFSHIKRMMIDVSSCGSSYDSEEDCADGNLTDSDGKPLRARLVQVLRME
ncbi:hypothetical protein LguiA_032085 [Lonicera macranthoides]